MRTVFGQAKLVRDDVTTLFGLEAPGLNNGMARLDLPLDLNTAALEPYIGKVVGFNGRLHGEPGQNITRLTLAAPQLMPLHSEGPAVSMAIVAAGNLGSAPEENEAKTAVVGSMAVYLPDSDGAWLRIFAPLGYQAATQLRDMPKGAAILLCGHLETYSYKGKDGTKKDGLQVTPISISTLPRQGTGRPAPLASTTAPAESIPGEASTAADAFVGAA